MLRPERSDFPHNVLFIPHIAGSTDISKAGIVDGTSENIRRLEKGEELLYVKN